MITNTIRALVILMALTIIPFEMYSQCGTKFSPKKPIKWESDSRTGARSSYTVNVFIHVIANDNGNGGIDYNDIVDDLFDAADFFSDANICFKISGSDLIKESGYFTYEDDYFNNLILRNPHTDAIDIYVLPVQHNGTNAGYYGKAKSPFPSTALVIYGNFMTDGRVLAHELGHCLGLFHPGEPGICAELVDGTNCNNCGDLICDTPAEPGQIDASDVSNCIYIGSETDSNGDIYTPDLTNLMSDEEINCNNHFTQGQFDYMCNSIDNSQVLLNTLEPQVLNIPSLTFPISVQNIPINDLTVAASVGIVAENLTVENDGLLSFKAGEYIILSPDTHIKAGAYFHAFIEDPVCDITTFGAELKQGGEVVSKFDDLPGETDPTNEIRFVDDQEHNIEILVQPNPFNTEADLQIQNINSSYLKLQILDSRGAIVKKYEKKVMTDKASFRIQGNDMKSGYYFYRLITDDNIYTGKMLKI